MIRPTSSERAPIALEPRRPGRRAWLASASALVLQACASTPPREVAAPVAPAAADALAPLRAASSVPAAPAVAATPPRPPRIGLALGGGAARGFAHVGVLGVLEREGIRVDCIAGTSAGSLVGALHASGMSAALLRQTALDLDEATLGDWTLSFKGLLRGRALQDTVNRLVGSRPIEQFPLPFAATAVDLSSGQLVEFRRGDAGVAVRASSAVPGIFEPVKVAGREYIDGGVVSPVPVRTVRSLGADVVIAVDISAKPAFQSTDNMARVLWQTFTIMSQHLAHDELRRADVVIAPAVGELGGTDFKQRTLALAEGERAANAALPAIREALRRAQVSG